MSKLTPHTHAPARCSARRQPRRSAAALRGPSMDSIATARVASATVRPSASRANLHVANGTLVTMQALLPLQCVAVALRPSETGAADVEQAAGLPASGAPSAAAEATGKLPAFDFSRATPAGQIPNEDAPRLLWSGLDHDPRTLQPALDPSEGDEVGSLGLFATLARDPRDQARRAPRAAEAQHQQQQTPPWTAWRARAPGTVSSGVVEPSWA